MLSYYLQAVMKQLSYMYDMWSKVDKRILQQWIIDRYIQSWNKEVWQKREKKASTNQAWTIYWLYVLISVVTESRKMRGEPKLSWGKTVLWTFLRYQTSNIKANSSCVEGIHRPASLQSHGWILLKCFISKLPTLQILIRSLSIICTLELTRK